MALSGSRVKYYLLTQCILFGTFELVIGKLVENVAGCGSAALLGGVEKTNQDWKGAKQMWIMSVFKHGHSYAVVIPARLMKSRGWRPGSRVVWTVGDDGRLIVEGLTAAVQRKAEERGK